MLLRILANLIWLLLQILPDFVSLWLLDHLWPNWMNAIDRARERRP